MKSASSILLLCIFLLILGADESAGFAATFRNPARSILFKKVTQYHISLLHSDRSILLVRCIVSSARGIKLILIKPQQTNKNKLTIFGSIFSKDKTIFPFSLFSNIQFNLLVSKTILQFICGELNR